MRSLRTCPQTQHWERVRCITTWCHRSFSNCEAGIPTVSKSSNFKTQDGIVFAQIPRHRRTALSVVFGRFDKHSTISHVLDNLRLVSQGTQMRCVVILSHASLWWHYFCLRYEERVRRLSVWFWACIVPVEFHTHFWTKSAHIAIKVWHWYDSDRYRISALVCALKALSYLYLFQLQVDDMYHAILYIASSSERLLLFYSLYIVIYFLPLDPQLA